MKQRMGLLHRVRISRHFTLQNREISMPQNTIFPDIVTYLTNTNQLSPRNLFLKMRYKYSHQLPIFLDFLSFVIVTPNINIQQPIQLSRVVQLTKELFLEADLYTLLLLLSKICPLMKSKHNLSRKKAALQNKFKEWVGTSKSKINIGNALTEIGKELGEMFQWMQKTNYLTFYIQNMNHHILKNYADIDIFFSELDMNRNTPFNQTQIAFLKTQMLTQYQKMSNPKYKQETVTCLYQWFKEELKLSLAEPFDNSNSLLSIDTLSRVVRADCDLANSSLVQACEYILPLVRPPSLESLILLVDELLLASSAITIIQNVLVVVPAIFLKAVQPKTKLNCDLISLHLQFWRHTIGRRFVDSTLLMCLNDWIKRILNLSNNPSKIQELLQLFKTQLERKVKNKNLQDLKCIFAEKEIQKIQQLYQEIQIYHQILQKSNVSYFVPQKKQNNRDNFNYQTSLLSSKGELMSMLDSIHKKEAELKVNNVEQNQQQLKIYSNKNSVAHEDSEEDRTAQRVNHAISLLNLLQLKPQKKKKEYSSVASSKKSAVMPFLPLFSTDQRLPNQHTDFTQISDPYGLNLKCRQYTYEIDPIFVPISESNRKKVIKNKGMIIKTNAIEIGYIFESVLSRRRLSLFITFDQPVANVSISVEENSIKFTKTFSIEFENPKIKKQFKTQLDIEKASLYKIQGYQQARRLIKPKILIKMQQKLGKQTQMKEQIPFYLYNLIEWLEISQKQEEIFSLQAQVSTPWHRASSSVRKTRSPQITILFPHCKLDEKGNILIKLRFLLEVIFCKIYVVLDKCKVELINSDCETILLALLQMIVIEHKSSQ